MANFVPRVRAHRSSALFSSVRRFSSEDALVEIKPGEVGLVSGIPEQHLRRRVVIHSPARSATQQGSGKVGKSFNGLDIPGDPYANVGEAALSFDSAAAAKAFAEKYGWEYTVKKFHAPLLKPKSYADNFKWEGPPKTEDDKIEL